MALEDQIPDICSVRLIQPLIDQWRKEADVYQSNHEEGQSKGLSTYTMQASAIMLRQCAKDLERAIKK